MPPRIRSHSPTIAQDLAACLSPEAIKKACRASGHRWRDPPRSIPSRQSTSSCSRSSRQHRLPARCSLRDLEVLGVGLLPSSKATAAGRLSKLLKQITAKLRQTTQSSSLWLGRHRVWIVDGSSFSMFDVKELQR